ncbi:MAG: hypothetical protein U1A25_02715 [Candidatus Sungbacteria bacterium]|nr:hypothetical protein [Candidatus Sungbacteria bacterium]
MLRRRLARLAETSRGWAEAPAKRVGRRESKLTLRSVLAAITHDEIFK